MLSDLLTDYWKCDEASGDLLSAHSSNHFTEVGGSIGAATGKINGGRDCEDGSGNYFVHASNSSLACGAGVSFAVQIWVNFESLPASGFMGLAQKWGGAGANEFLGYAYLNTSNSLWYFAMGTSADGTNGSFAAYPYTTISTGTWYCVHYMYDQSLAAMYVSVNGTKYTAGAAGYQCFGGSGDFVLGQIDGIIDEAARWNRPLVDSELTDLFNGGNGRPYSYINPTAPKSPVPSYSRPQRFFRRSA